MILCLVVATGTLSATEDKAAEIEDIEELERLMAATQARLDAMKEAAASGDQALEFLTKQVDEAVESLSSQRDRNDNLRQENVELSSSVEDLARLRAELDDELGRVRTERVTVVAELEAQLAALSDMLSMERQAKAALSERLDDLSTELRATLGEKDALNDELAHAHKLNAAHEAALRTQDQDLAARQARHDDLTARLAGVAVERDEQTRRAEAAHARVLHLDRQIAALRAQLAALVTTLEATEAKNKEKEVQIANLGRRLNVALASKVQELARYRSEFFGRLREVMGSREDVRIVGDRFVFQSEVLFGTGSAELGQSGKVQLGQLADTLQEIAAKIPDDLPWVLRVDGHTDHRPIKTTAFASNWELSAARAISVVKFLIDQGIAADHLAAAGFGEFQPLDPGASEAALRRNRRIELKLTQ